MPNRLEVCDCPLTLCQRVVKRSMDVAVAAVGISLCWWLVLLAWVIAAVDTHASGFFVQTRIGRYGRPFRLIKIRTMTLNEGGTVVTTSADRRITRSGAWLRRLKIDELPQLFNVLLGNMSLVGPRPDVPGFADRLEGDDKVILTVRPGITGPATLRFRNEEAMLAGVTHAERFNQEVIYPEKVRMNREYVEGYSLLRDIELIWCTIFPWCGREWGSAD